MTTIYCDASHDAHYNIATWACIIISKRGRVTAYTGDYRNMTTAPCELHAVVKALGKVKPFPGEITLYTDFELIPQVFDTHNAARYRQLAQRDSAWLNLLQYTRVLQGRLAIKYISRRENPAHALALQALRALRADQKREERA